MAKMSLLHHSVSTDSSSSGSSSSSKRFAGHRLGYYLKLAEEYPFLITIEDSENDEHCKVVELLLSLCKKKNADQRNHSGMWTTKPCFCISLPQNDFDNIASLLCIEKQLRKKLFYCNQGGMVGLLDQWRSGSLLEHLKSLIFNLM